MSVAEVPDGLQDILQEFTEAAIRQSPNNLYKFARDYFEHKYTQNKLATDDEEVEPLPTLYSNRRYERRKSVAAERYDPAADDEEVEQIVHPKTDEQRRRLKASVSIIFIFSSLDKNQIGFVLDAMKAREVKAGDVIIREGDQEADYFYVIDSGEFEILMSDKVVYTYVQEGSFGELALLYNTPRSATVRAVTDGSLWTLDRQSFRRIILKSAYQKRKRYEDFIERVPILKYLEPYERMKVCDALNPITFQDGHVIIRQGETAECMYFLESGEVRVMRTMNNGEIQEIKRIRNCGYFGELGLISKKPRAANVIAVGVTKCLALDVLAFERLLGRCLEVMGRNIESYDEEVANTFGGRDQISDLR